MAHETWDFQRANVMGGDAKSGFHLRKKNSSQGARAFQWKGHQSKQILTPAKEASRAFQANQKRHLPPPTLKGKQGERASKTSLRLSDHKDKR